MIHNDNDIGIVSFVDRDMMMRYHWGQGVGHTYCRGSNIAARNSLLQIEQPEDDGTNDLEVSGEYRLDGLEVGGEEMGNLVDALEYGMNERENEQLAGSDEEVGQEDLDDDTLLEMADMYYSQVL
jgi:hypothetical protein